MGGEIGDGREQMVSMNLAGAHNHICSGTSLQERAEPGVAALEQTRCDLDPSRPDPNPTWEFRAANPPELAGMQLRLL